MRITRGLLIPMTVILGVATIVIAIVMYLTQRPLVTYASLPLLLGCKFRFFVRFLYSLPAFLRRPLLALFFRRWRNKGRC